MDEIILKIENLYVEIKDKYSDETLKVVNDLCLDVYKGKTVGIVGESGSGKTITALSTMGLQNENTKIVSGNILFCNKDLLNMKNKKELFGQRISMIFQDPISNLNPLMKIGKQIEENAIIHLNINKKERKAMARKVMEYVGLTDIDNIYNSYPHQLSGGMRQRAMIASAIILNPDLIIADEPTTALDVTIESQIIDLLIKLKKENNTAMIFISHDFEVISHVSDYVAVMYKGYILEYGRNEDLIKNPAHPYTKALIKCIPSPDKKGKPLYRIRDSIGKNDNGCPFADRCDFTKDKCYTAVPNYEKRGNRYIRCIRYGEIDG